MAWRVEFLPDNDPHGLGEGYTGPLKVGPRTAIKPMTDGILLAETQSDPELRAYDSIILDERME